MRFQRPGVCRQLLHLVAMDERATLRTLQCARRNFPSTARTLFLRHFRTKLGHQSATPSWLHHLISPAKDWLTAYAFNYSSSALIVYSPAEMSQFTCRMFGLQQTWQSSTYCWRIPAEESTLVSFHSPHPAHWNPAVMTVIDGSSKKEAANLLRRAAALLDLPRTKQ